MITTLPTWLSISDTIQNSFTVSSVGGTRGVPHGAPTSTVSGLCPFHKLSASTRASMAPARVQLPDTTRRVSGFSSKPCSIFCSALQIRSHKCEGRVHIFLFTSVSSIGKCRIFLVAIRQMALPGRVEISRKTLEIAEGTFSTVGIQLFLFPDGLFLFGACREHHMASTSPVTDHRHFDVDPVVLVCSM